MKEGHGANDCLPGLIRLYTGMGLGCGDPWSTQLPTRYLNINNVLSADCAEPESDL